MQKYMKNKSLNAGFAPLLIIAIVAILAIGTGVYVVEKNKEAKKAELEGNAETQANANADLNANANANLGVNANAKASLRSLLALGKSSVCTFTSSQNGATSSGTMYISASGDMRGDFQSQTSSGTQASSMIVKDGTSYVWSGSQGAKMKTNASASANASAQAKNSVDLDQQVNYDCSDWTVDSSKFTLPSGVNFVDIEAMLKGSVKGVFDINK